MSLPSRSMGFSSTDLAFCSAAGTSSPQSGSQPAARDTGRGSLPSFAPSSCFFCSCGLLPWFLGLDGIWLSVPCAELFTLPVFLFSLQGSYQGGDFHFPQGHPCRLMTIHRAHRYLLPCLQLCLSGVSAHRQKDAEVPPFWESLRIFSVSFGVAFCFLASAFSFASSFCLTLALFALCHLFRRCAQHPPWT